MKSETKPQPELFVGRSLRETHDIYDGTIVISRIEGVNVNSRLTRDYNTNRLNVELDPKTIRVIKKALDIGSETIEFEEADPDSLDDGIVIAAYYG